MRGGFRGVDGDKTVPLESWVLWFVWLFSTTYSIQISNGWHRLLEQGRTCRHHGKNGIWLLVVISTTGIVVLDEG